jgi:ankyrin repeat protein
MLTTDDESHIINKKDGNGYTPLYIASKNGNLEVVKLLFKNKVDPLITIKVNYFKSSIII